MSIDVYPPAPVDTELASAAALSDSYANPTTAPVGSFVMGWDNAASLWRRLRVVGGTGYLQTSLISPTGNLVVVDTPTSDGVTGAANYALAASSYGMVWNGSTWDRASGSTLGANTLPRKYPVALVTRTLVTTSYTSATLDTPYGRGVQLIVNVSAAPGAQTISINLYSITSTFGVPALTAANVINNTGSFFVELYPGVTEVAATAGPAIVNRRVSGALADQFLVYLAHSGAGSWTYTVQYCLIP